jgi:hypothetical protein
MTRLLAVGALLAGAFALYLSVASGLRSEQTAAAACGGSARNEIRYRVVSNGVHGTAGCGVRAVIVRLNGGGAVWAKPRGGTFVARVPEGLRVRTVVKVLTDGTRQRFAVSP